MFKNILDMARSQADASSRSSTSRAPKILVGAVLAVMAGLIVANGFQVIETGNVGVRSTLGQINMEEVQPGLRFAIPFIQTIEPVFTKTVMVNYSSTESNRGDTQEIIYEQTLMGEDANGLPLGIDLTVEVAPVDGLMADMYIETGRQGFDKKVVQTVRSVGRKVLSSFEADVVMTKRAELNSGLTKDLTAAFEDSRYFKLTSVQLKQIVLPPKVKDAIEAVALQRQQAAASREQIGVRDAEAEALKKKAGGEAEAARISAQGRADAVAIEADAQAKAYLKINAALTDRVIALETVKAWQAGGSQVPTVQAGNGSGLLLNIPTPAGK